MISAKCHSGKAFVGQCERPLIGLSVQAAWWRQ
jgi:hypothetical protein